MRGSLVIPTSHSVVGSSCLSQLWCRTLLGTKPEGRNVQGLVMQSMVAPLCAKGWNTVKDVVLKDKMTGLSECLGTFSQNDFEVGCLDR